MYNAWLSYKELVDNPYNDRSLIETLGWSVIEKGSKSSSPLVRAMAVLGAHYGQDAKGVRIIQRSLRDYNALVRDIAVQTAATMRDERIKREVLSLFNTEEAWPNKLNVVRALGKMKIKEAMKPLIALVESNATTAELKAAAIASITEIQDTITRKDVVSLSASTRAGFRLLACEAVAAFDREQDLDRVVMLLKDPNADVRLSAIRALGSHRPKDVDGVDVPTLIAPLVNDNIEKVAIAASWLMMQYDPVRGQQLMEPWLWHSRQEVRIFASAALAASGKYGFPLVTKVFYTTKDSYVRMNLAIAMVSQRKDVEFACMALRESLAANKDRWMWKEESRFRAIAPSTVKRNASIPQLPEATDMMVRLEVLNILAIMKDPYAQNSIRDFLRERSWGVSGTASATLLTEGDDAAVDLVEALLNDPDKTIKVQAALILSLWGTGERALDILKEAYPTADRDLKERILEGLGRVGSTETIPFLVDALADPHPSLRIIAAASLLKALYN
jgi:HEAT repeat protein